MTLEPFAVGTVTSEFFWSSCQFRTNMTEPEWEEDDLIYVQSCRLQPAGPKTQGGNPVTGMLKIHRRSFITHRHDDGNLLFTVCRESLYSCLCWCDIHSGSSCMNILYFGISSRICLHICYIWAFFLWVQAFGCWWFWIRRVNKQDLFLKHKFTKKGKAKVYNNILIIFRNIIWIFK